MCEKEQVRMMTHNFKEIIAWQKAHLFVIQVYRITASFPASERYGLCSQFQRAAVSIPANMAEGYRRDGYSDKLRFMNIAQGSLEECRYYILLAKDLNYISINNYNELNASIEETSKLLNAYYKGIKDRHV